MEKDYIIPLQEAEDATDDATAKQIADTMESTIQECEGDKETLRKFADAVGQDVRHAFKEEHEKYRKEEENLVDARDAMLAEELVLRTAIKAAQTEAAPVGGTQPALDSSAQMLRGVASDTIATPPVTGNFEQREKAMQTLKEVFDAFREIIARAPPPAPPPVPGTADERETAMDQLSKILSGLISDPAATATADAGNALFFAEPAPLQFSEAPPNAFASMSSEVQSPPPVMDIPSRSLWTI